MLCADARPSAGQWCAADCRRTVPRASSPPLPTGGGRSMPRASTPARQSILTGRAPWHGHRAARTAGGGRAAALAGAPNAAPLAMHCARPGPLAPGTTTLPVDAAHRRALPTGGPLPPTPRRPPSPRPWPGECGRPALVAPGRPARDAGW